MRLFEGDNWTIDGWVFSERGGVCEWDVILTLNGTTFSSSGTSYGGIQATRDMEAAALKLLRWRDSGRAMGLLRALLAAHDDQADCAEYLWGEARSLLVD
jgi:hypothetical protein